MSEQQKNDSGGHESHGGRGDLGTSGEVQLSHAETIARAEEWLYLNRGHVNGIDARNQIRALVAALKDSDPPRLRNLAAEFVRYWTTDRTPDGCGMCGGIPHSTTCYVGRMAAQFETGNQASAGTSGSVPSAAPKDSSSSQE